MSERQEKAESVIRELGAMSALEVARTLRSENVTGFRMSADDCPIAVYVQKKTGAGAVCVSPWWLNGTGIDPIDLPRSVKCFIAAFDMGLFPRLKRRRNWFRSGAGRVRS